MQRGRLRVGILDMNAGHSNHAVRCIHAILDQFEQRLAFANPHLEVERYQVSPRDKGDALPTDCHLYLATGGPGSPYDGDGHTWSEEFGSLLDDIIDDNDRTFGRGQGLFAICYSFELIVRHLAVAEVVPRASRKLGVMPVYPTLQGRDHPLLSAFGDRFFAFEHREWEAVSLDESALARCGGRLLARESRDGHSKGRALLAFEFAPGIEGVQFHPEADRAGVLAWLACPPHAEAFRTAYGNELFDRMVRTLDDPERLARTYSVVIPGWLSRRFNLLAELRGWSPLADPGDDLAGFGLCDNPPPSSLVAPRRKSGIPEIPSVLLGAHRTRETG